MKDWWSTVAVGSQIYVGNDQPLGARHMFHVGYLHAIVHRTPKNVMGYSCFIYIYHVLLWVISCYIPLLVLSPRHQHMIASVTTFGDWSASINPFSLGTFPWFSSFIGHDSFPSDYMIIKTYCIYHHVTIDQLIQMFVFRFDTLSRLINIFFIYTQVNCFIGHLGIIICSAYMLWFI